MSSIYIAKGKEDRIYKGHSWIYSGDITGVEGEYVNGDIVEVFAHNGRFIGKGYVNDNSKIAVRMLTRLDEEIDESFFEKRISQAMEYRDVIAPKITSKRLIYSEGDNLPGIIVDQYEDVLVVQILSLGIDIRRDMIIDILKRKTGISKVYERSDSKTRYLEGLEPKAGFIGGEFSTKFDMIENGFKMKIDVENGQKTGYFLDQRENRASIAQYVEGGEVLDCFCHTGSFSVHAVGYGAKKVTAVDVSESAIEMAKANLELNNPDCDCDLIIDNVFDVLRQYERERKEFDVVILDPPAFTKSRAAVDAALRGYKDINMRGAKIVKEGGYLLTASCSHHVSEGDFLEMTKEALADARRIGRLIEVRTQAKDHPIALGIPETKYLKFLAFQLF